METILYNILIFPLVQILNLCYLFFFRIFNSHGISIIGVSVMVSILTLPLYFEAEKWHQLERNIHKKLEPKISKIKSAFRGDERYMVLSTFYRQNHYHPIYSLRGSIGLLLQIPFFIAAYFYLSKLDAIVGTPFLGISNLGAPDGMLGINILPILATKDIIPNPVNPFTEKTLEAKKDNGVTITSSQNFTKPQHKYGYDIDFSEWLHVKENIFDSRNWRKVRID